LIVQRGGCTRPDDLLKGPGALATGALLLVSDAACDPSADDLNQFRDCVLSVSASLPTASLSSIAWLRGSGLWNAPWASSRRPWCTLCVCSSSFLSL